MPAVEEKYVTSIKKKPRTCSTECFQAKRCDRPLGSVSPRASTADGSAQCHRRGCSLGCPNGIKSTSMKTSESVKDETATQNHDAFQPGPSSNVQGPKALCFPEETKGWTSSPRSFPAPRRIPHRACCLSQVRTVTERYHYPDPQESRLAESQN